MQPYQRSGEEMRKKSEQAESLLKKGGRLAVTAATGLAGGSLISKALPFLAEGITAKNAIAGITALSPKFGKFINEGLKQGESFDKIKSFLTDKLVTAAENEPKSLFESLIGDVDLASLGESIQKKLQSLVPIANQLEKKGKKEGDPEVNNLKKQINKILKAKGRDSKLSIENIIKSGENLAALQPEQQQLQDMVMGSIGQEDQGQPQQPVQPPQGQMGEPQQPQQAGQGQQALMAILQKIQASRGAGG